MIAAVPAYCDAFIAAFERGVTGDHMHLGHWNRPPGLAVPVDAGEFEAAQARLADRLIAMADVPASAAILDVACGLGGTLRLLNARQERARLTGLNLDPRQIALCRRLVAARGNTLGWLVGDAGRLPLADAAFDAVLCIEAMFHFADRGQFLGEAARVLRPGGVLVVSDLLLSASDAPMPLEPALIERVLRADYGPWPQPWTAEADLLALAADAGLSCTDWIDASAATLPSYRTIARTPHRHGARWSGATLMRALHEAGTLRYVYARFRKPPSPCPAPEPLP